MSPIIGGLIGFVFVVLIMSGVIAVMLRRVVPTNYVHIVQYRTGTVPYGAKRPAGNVYYEFPEWLPRWGVVVSKFPESIFDVSLRDYEAYDQGRLPFLVDVKAFFKIKDAEVAAQRVSSFDELKDQLSAVLQGAVRRVLATNHLENIMQDRSTLGNQFTEEVNSQLTSWGVETVKSIEFMDIRDSKGSNVIHNIMEKEKSRIDKESRSVVAENSKLAQQAEIEAQQMVDIRKLEANQVVGERKASTEKAVGIARERSNQEVQAEARVTAERMMAVQQVNEVKTAEIQREVSVVQADAKKQVAVVQAEGEKQVLVTKAEGTKESTVITSTGNLEASKNNAEGIKVVGEAEGAAEKARLMAPVDAQITLATKIGENKDYQQYLVTIENVKAGQAVGIEMAKALANAEIKVIANGGDVASGVAGIGNILSGKGGTAVGAFMSALAQNPDVAAVATKALEAVEKK